MKDTCDFPAFTTRCLRGNILHVNIKPVKTLTAVDVSQIFNCYKEYNGGAGAYVLVSFSGFLTPGSDGMEAANASVNQKYIRAMAYVIKSSALRLGAKFFMRFYKPKYGSDIFSTKSEAITWLLSEQKKQS